MNRLVNIIGFVFLLFTTTSFSSPAGNNPVITASESVYRIWIAKNLTEEVNQALKDRIKIEGYINANISGEQLIIFAYKDDYYILTGHGSGFFVSEEQLVTNHHVIESVISGKNKAFVLNKITPKFDVKEVSIMWSSKEKDLAILNVETDDWPAISFASGDGIIQTLPVSSIGFPGASDDISGGILDFQSYIEPVIQKGTLTARHTDPATSVKTWQHDAPISVGNSGGPLVNDCGQVVGINSAGHKLQQNTLIAISIEELLPELKKLNIKYNQQSESCSIGAEKSTLFTKVLLGGIVILILSILVYLVYLKSQIKQGKALQSSSRLISAIIKKLNIKGNDVEDEDKWLIDDHGRQYWFDPISGIQYKDDMPKPEPKVDNRYILLILSSDSRKVKLLVGQDIIVGRSSSADVVLSNSHISSQHVKLSYDGFRVLIDDFGSTNGTELNGEKITKKKIIGQNATLILAGEKGDKIDIVFPVSEIGNNVGKIIAVLKPISDDSLPEIILKENELVSIGRSSCCTVSIKNKNISSQHCFLRAHRNGSVTLEDSNSTNGTFVEGIENRVKKTQLYKGNKVYLADKRTEYQVY